MQEVAERLRDEVPNQRQLIAVLPQRVRALDGCRARKTEEVRVPGLAFDQRLRGVRPYRDVRDTADDDAHIMKLAPIDPRRGCDAGESIGKQRAIHRFMVDAPPGRRGDDDLDDQFVRGERMQLPAVIRGRL